MRCIKCGCEIPDGELFCVACSLTPAGESGPKPSKPKATPVKKVAPPMPAPQPAPKPQAVPKQKKKISALLAPFILMTVLAIGLGTYIFLSYEDIARQSRALQVRDADLIIKEKEFQTAKEDLATANTDLEESKGQIYDLNKEIERLEEEARSWNSLASQSEFDLDTKTQEMLVLTQENTELADAVQTLEGDVTELQETVTTMEEEAKDRNADLKIAQTKAKFMDQYVVFINNEAGAAHYHSYDCSHFNKSNFFVYNPKLAESKGYEPCPYCRK